MLTEIAVKNPIVEWLEEGTGPADWFHWLEGDNRPLTAVQDDSYLWFIEALIASRNPRLARLRLVREIESILATPMAENLNPAADNRFRRPAMAIENLFLLCGELRERSIFFAPLLSIREQVARDRESGEPWVAVWDEGSSLPLEEAFERALVLNQNGPELEDTWFAILAAPMEDPQLEFPAVLNALEGVVHMPESADSAGQPWIGAIVDALALFACRLEEYYSNPDARNRALTRQINRAKSSFIDWTTADSDLLRKAVHSDGPRWPGWAFRRLKLFASAESGDLALPREVWVWKYLYECIPVNFEYSKLDLQCGSDEIVKLKVSEATFNYLQSVYHLFERARLDNPFPGVGSIMVGVLRALKEVAMHYPHLETQIADVRNRLFQQVRSSTEESHPFMREVLRRSAEALDRRTVAAEEKLSPVDAELLVEAWQAYRSEGNPASGSHFLRI